MSSMDLTRSKRPLAVALLLASSALAPASSAMSSQVIEPSAAQNARAWDYARERLVARQPGEIAQAVEKWDRLRENDNLPFEEYAGFILAYPGFPLEERLQTRAENALDDEIVPPARLVAFFDRNPPITNAAKGRYALALAGLERSNAVKVAREAWRGGRMDDVTEAYLATRFGRQFSAADQRARMDNLLWQGEADAAARQLARMDAGGKAAFAARLALLEGQEPSARGIATPANAITDPGYVYNLARYYRSTNRMAQAVSLLSTRPRFSSVPNDQEDLISEMLRVARAGSAVSAQRIATSVDDVFAPGTDISQLSFRLRDDYTSLMWLGGTKALWETGDPAVAAPLFYRYGAAAQTPQTRSKGFYWAGYAAQRAGDRAEANRYYEMAAQYPDRFYGMLALQALDRPIPRYRKLTATFPTPEQKLRFETAPLTQAVREVARDAPWRTGIQFYREIAQSADTLEEHLLVAELAREIGRRDLAVNIAEAAGADGIHAFVETGFPTIEVPPGTNWTIAHAIARQESQFAGNAISHAGARGLMQLMPATAREQAGKLGIQYMSASLIDDPAYNVRLGSTYFQRMLDYYDGAYPLALAAYNAGPGNVNKWLRANGDPRTGAIDYVKWIEEIPFFETKNYVQRVLENAVVYEHLYPKETGRAKPRTVNDFLRR